MIQSIPIKKEIIRTYLNNLNKPLEEITNLLFKQLDKTYLCGEKMLLDKTKRCVILVKDDNVYKVRLDNGNCIDVGFDRIERQEHISKNMVYGFLVENTTQTIFGRVLKSNVCNDIKKNEIEKEKDKEPEVKKIKTITNKPDKTQKKKTIEEYMKSSSVEKKIVRVKKYEDKVEMFDMFIFFTQFNSFVSFEYSFENFESFINEFTSMKFKHVVCKEFMKIIRMEMDENYFDDLIKVSLRMNCRIIELVPIEKGFLKVDKFDWKTVVIDKTNWIDVMKNFIYYAVQVDSSKTNLMNTKIFDDYFFVLAKFLMDIVIHTVYFKEHIDKVIEKIRKLEKERFELNCRAKKVDLNLSEDENCKNKRVITGKIIEIDKFLHQNRINPRIGRYDGSNYYYVNSEIYHASKSTVFLVDKSTMNEFLKQFKGIKDASLIVNFCKNIMEMEKNYNK